MADHYTARYASLFNDGNKPNARPGTIEAAGTLERSAADLASALRQAEFQGPRGPVRFDNGTDIETRQPCQYVGDLNSALLLRSWAVIDGDDPRAPIYERER